MIMDGADAINNVSRKVRLAGAVRSTAASAKNSKCPPRLHEGKFSAEMPAPSTPPGQARTRRDPVQAQFP